MNRKQYLLTNIKSFLITLIPVFTMIYFSHLVLVFNSTLSHQFEMFNLITSLSLMTLSLGLYSVYSFVLKREVPDKLNKIIKSMSFLLTGLLIFIVATNLVFFAVFINIVATWGAYAHSIIWSMAWVTVIVIAISAGIIKYFANKADEIQFNHQYRIVRNSGIMLAGSMLAVILLGEFGIVLWGVSFDAQFSITWIWSQTVIDVPLPGIPTVALDSWRLNSYAFTSYSLNNYGNTVAGGWQSYLLSVIYFSVILALIQVFVLAYFRKVTIKNASYNDLPHANRKISQDWYLFVASTMALVMAVIYFLNEYLLFAQFADMTINGTPLSTLGVPTVIGWALGSGVSPDFAGTVEGQLVTTYHSVNAVVEGNYAFGTVMFWTTNLLFIGILVGMPIAYVKENKITTKNWKEHFVFGGHK